MLQFSWDVVPEYMSMSDKRFLDAYSLPQIWFSDSKILERLIFNLTVREEVINTILLQLAIRENS